MPYLKRYQEKRSEIEKGSPEAYAWAEKMRAARQKKARIRHAVRQAGLEAEAKFFGPGGPLAPEALKKRKLNPGAKWHQGEEDVAYRYKKASQDQLEKAFFAGVEAAHKTSGSAARKMGMNPKKKRTRKNPIAVFNPIRKSTPEWFYDAGSRTYILDLRSATYQIRPTGSGFRYSYVIGGEVQYIRDAPEIETAMDEIDRTQGKKFKRPKGIYGSIRNNPPAPKVAGTIYNNAIEIKAQKTGGPLKGHYKHVFGSNVRILGLTDGTVLLQHKEGKPLWITRKDYERSGRKH